MTYWYRYFTYAVLIKISEWPDIFMNSMNDPIPSWTQWMTHTFMNSRYSCQFLSSANDPIPSWTQWMTQWPIPSWTQWMTRYLHELQVLVPVLELSPLQRLHMEVGTLDLLLKPPSCKINRFKSAVEENSSQFFIFEKGDKTPANLFRLSHVTVWLSCTSTWGWPAPLLVVSCHSLFILY